MCPSLGWGSGRHRWRVVRGGSWNNNQRDARCAYRNRNTPDNWNNNLGVRVVVSIALGLGRQTPSFTDAGRSPYYDESQSGPTPVAPAVGGRRPAKYRMVGLAPTNPRAPW